ncbi:hypothetical protein EPO15_04700 [bacterium]|nr:MAG: hypothetical protein EPO15_04700 [bacterium]
MAATVSKRPVYLHKSALALCDGPVSASEVLALFQKANAAGILLLSEGLPPGLADQLEKVCEDQEIFCRRVSPEEAVKRTAAIDLVIDMMLLKAG